MTAAAEPSLSPLQGQRQAPLSPGVLAALNRVQCALREALSRLAAPFSLDGLADLLARQGLLVTLRSGLGVGVDCPDYLSTLRHTFLICQEGSSGLCIVVDPSFREQFVVAGMPSTSSYVTAVASVPECFIGTIGTVNALVCLLTGTLQQESSALGLELPPWRSAKALMSKWLPRRFSDRVFTPPASNLHPLLLSTLHGAPAASSPISVQSWLSLRSGESRTTAASSRTSTAACCNQPSDRASQPHCAVGPVSCLSEPATVVKGFSSPARSCGTPRTGCTAAQNTRSALTQQLAAANEASRAIQAQAQAHWERCLQACGQAGTEEDDDLCGIGSSSGGSDLRVGSCGLVRSLVVSPVPRRHCSPASARRETCSGLKLSTATLKQLPRIYTVKLTAVAAC